MILARIERGIKTKESDSGGGNELPLHFQLIPSFFASKMTSTDQLPREALAATFLFLNARESIGCRGVCKRWSSAAGAGCLILRLRGQPARSRLFHGGVGSVVFAGKMAEKKTLRSKGGDDDEDKKPSAAESIRARGHLPQPATLSAKSHSGKMTFASDRLINGVPEPYNTNLSLPNSIAFHVPDTQRSDAITGGHVLTLTRAELSEGYTCAIRAEGLPRIVKSLVSLDLSSSSSVFQDCCSARGSDNKIFDKLRKYTKPRPLRNSLEHLDVSALHNLEQLSLRGCGNLKSLNLPPSLQTLDAGGCSKLERIYFPRGSKSCLTALDIGGCRSLRENKRRTYNRLPGLLGPNTGTALTNIVNLDISHVCKGDALDQVFCDALRRASCLEAFSLRYGATDDVLVALAESESAHCGKLRLVDIAFSTNISDESVETLARKSPSLERLNLRGCKKVSSSCYNHIPVYLERRRRRVEDGKMLELDESFRSCSRKGDNLFYFCQKK